MGRCSSFAWMAPFGVQVALFCEDTFLHPVRDAFSYLDAISAKILLGAEAEQLHATGWSYKGGFDNQEIIA